MNRDWQRLSTIFGDICENWPGWRYIHGRGFLISQTGKYLMVSHEFIRENAEKIDLEGLCRNWSPTEEDADILADVLRWDCISYENLSIEFIERHWDRICSRKLSEKPNLPEEFIEKHRQILDFSRVAAGSSQVKVLPKYHKFVKFADYFATVRVPRKIMEEFGLSLPWCLKIRSSRPHMLDELMDFNAFLTSKTAKKRKKCIRFEPVAFGNFISSIE